MTSAALIVKIMIRVVVLCLLAGTALAHPVEFQSTDTPPYWSAKLPDNGLGGAILKLLSDEAGVAYTINYLPVKRFRRSGATYLLGDPDILVNQTHRAIFPIGVFNSAFFYYQPRQAAIEVHSLKDLQGRTLGVLRGTIEDKEFFTRSGVKVEESDSVASLLYKLKRGRIDVCILVEGTGRYTIGQLFPAEQAAFAGVLIPGLARPIAVMIDLDNPEGKAIAQRYRMVLDKMMKSQKYRSVLKDFYGPQKIPADRIEQLDKFKHDYAKTWDK